MNMLPVPVFVKTFLNRNRKNQRAQ